MSGKFDPWTRVATIRGLPADEVISALQKEIRRGNTENAVLCAYEMMDTSAALENYMWDRLAVISVEDIGFGEVLAPILIESLERLSRRFPRGEGDRYMFAIQAVRYLATRLKDRSTNDMYSWIKYAVENQNVVPEIPDYAVDMHTERGRSMGRERRHYHEEATELHPRSPGADTRYRQRLLKILQSDQ